MGDKYDDKQELVMANLFGKPIDTSNVTTRHLKKMLEQAEAVKVMDELFTKKGSGYYQIYKIKAFRGIPRFFCLSAYTL